VVDTAPIVLLADIDDPAATLTAEALSRWLAGEDFESACGLVPGWRRYLQQTVRARALAALVVARSDLNDCGLGAWIAAGVERSSVHARHPVRLRRRFETIELRDAIPE
jgi:hypothetical protein